MTDAVHVVWVAIVMCLDRGRISRRLDRAYHRLWPMWLLTIGWSMIGWESLISTWTSVQRPMPLHVKAWR